MIKNRVSNVRLLDEVLGSISHRSLPAPAELVDPVGASLEGALIVRARRTT
jgi:hypothetical protein